VNEPGNHTLLLEIQHTLGALSSQVQAVQNEAKAIARKVWRGNGGSIVEVQVRQGEQLETALQRLERVEKQLDELPKATAEVLTFRGLALGLVIFAPCSRRSPFRASHTSSLTSRRQASIRTETNFSRSRPSS